jgi:hypothetical protein
LGWGIVQVQHHFRNQLPDVKLIKTKGTHSEPLRQKDLE